MQDDDHNEEAETESDISEWVDDDTFDEYILQQPKIKRGSFILKICKIRDGWIKIKTTSKYNNSTAKVERELGEYWNYKLEDGTEDGAYFKKGQYWGVLFQEDLYMDPDKYVITVTLHSDQARHAMKRIYLSILCLCLLGHAVADNETTALASNVTEAKESETVVNINNNATESNENQNSTGADKTLGNVKDNSNNRDNIKNDNIGNLFPNT